jgi:hypothetical protein
VDSSKGGEIMTFLRVSKRAFATDTDKWWIEREIGSHVWKVYQVLPSLEMVFVNDFETLTQAQVYCEIH